MVRYNSKLRKVKLNRVIVTKQNQKHCVPSVTKLISKTQSVISSSCNTICDIIFFHEDLVMWHLTIVDVLKGHRGFTNLTNP